jgi:prevent-host-death family protein
MQGAVFWRNVFGEQVLAMQTTCVPPWDLFNYRVIRERIAHLSAYLKESQQGPVIVTRNGTPVAVLLAVTDEDELDRLVLAHSPKFQALLAKSRRQIEEMGGIPHDEFWRQVRMESRGQEGNSRGLRRARKRT